MQRIQGWSEQGNTKVLVSGLSSTTLVQKSFPGSTITVYLTGTLTLASLYSDDVASPTPLGNPFTVSASGNFGFYVTNGQYDLVFSGTGIATPFTLVALGAGTGGAGVQSYAFASLPTSKTQNSGNLARITTAQGGLWMDTGVQWSKVGPEISVRDAPFNATGDGATNDRTALNTANTNASALTNGGTLLFPDGTYRVSNSITFAANVTLRFSGGAFILVDSGVTVTVNGSVIAAKNQKIFSNVSGPDAGLGIVNFGQGASPFVTPQWFGAKQDGSTDDYHPLMAAIYAGQVSGAIMTVELLAAPSYYMTSKTLELPKYTHIQGNKSNSSLIKAMNPFTGTSIFQNWRFAQGSVDTAPATTSGTGYPCSIIFLEDFQTNSNNQSLNHFNLIHLQEGTVIRDLILQGNSAPAIGNANVRDGFRVYTNSDPGTSTQTWGMTNIAMYGQFRYGIDLSSVGWLWFDKINITIATKDFIRVSSGEALSFNNLEILVPDTQCDDTAGTAAMNIRDVTHLSGDNVTLAAAGSTGFVNRVGLLIDDTTGFPNNRNYILTNFRTTYNSAGAARFASDVKDNTISPARLLTDQAYLILSKGFYQGHTTSALRNFQFPTGWAAQARSFRDGEPQAVAFNAGNFTGSGAQTWTLQSGDQLQFYYSVVGRQITVTFDFATTSTNGGASGLRVAIPGGYTVSTARVQVPILVYNNGGALEIGEADADVGLAYISFYRAALANWSAAADTTRVTGQITFWI